jgi:6-oxo-cyclohex-1-ene-carbonyl-CoA hydrolase
VISDIAPALKVDGKYVANPLVETTRIVDDYGRLVFGKPKTGEALKAGQELMKRGTVDLDLLDQKVEALCSKLLYTFPDCTTKTVEELRKPKLDAWNRNKENSRAWLALNMMTEARAGFRAFNEGTRETGREIDFIALRRALAANTPWSDELTESVMPRAKDKR